MTPTSDAYEPERASCAARVPSNESAYARRVAEGPCFVCATVAGHPDYRHDVFYDDGITIGFLSRYPTLLGYAIVAPQVHIERWEQEQRLDEHLALQRILYLTARALGELLPAERLYVMSLGSAKGNAHVHWHVAPLPPGVPYERQQFHALMTEHGILAVDDAARRRLGEQLSAHIPSPGAD